MLTRKLRFSGPALREKFRPPRVEEIHVLDLKIRGG